MPHVEVAGGDGSFTSQEQFHGTQALSIPSADLTGGFDRASVEGDAATVLDMDQILEGEEILEVHMVKWGTELVHAGSPDTGEETVLQSALALDDEVLVAVVGSAAPANGGTAEQTDGIVDIDAASTNEQTVLDAATVYAYGGRNDDTNGVGASKFSGEYRKTIQWAPGQGPVLDTTDEIAIPCRFGIGPTSGDVIAHQRVHIWGETKEDPRPL